MDDKKYTFDVDVRANKTQVLRNRRNLWVNVKNVNIMNVRGKLKRQGRYSGYTKKRRKAIVALTADSKEIKIFED